MRRIFMGFYPDSRTEQYDMGEIIKRLVDNSEFEEYKEGLWENHPNRVCPN